ncbi:MAG: hypothetical protein N3D14_00935 [Aquificaceae bacterium]|nr:hypothetical protein [Aquificaceae bacterium]MCX8163942.1 hypothetical protein [Aquificaceae bacterium]
MRFEEFKNLLRKIEPFNKGWRGIVFKSYLNGKEVAIKVAKGKEKEYAIRKEGEILKVLKGIDGFPQLVEKGEDFVAYEFIQGVPIEKARLNKGERILVYLKVLDLIGLLDSLGINKDELQHLEKNTLVGEGLKVYLLDFERGSLGAKKRHNLSQFLQLLVREGFLGLEYAKELGKRYARGEEVYHEVRKALQNIA